MAGVVPLSNESTNGLLSSNQYKWLFPIADKIGTTDKKMIVKASMSGKVSFLCGFMKNYNSAGMLHISLAKSDTIVSNARWIVKQSSVKFFYKDNEANSYELYVSGLSSWAECAFIRLTGGINEVTIVDAVPEDAVPITISD